MIKKIQGIKILLVFLPAMLILAGCAPANPAPVALQNSVPTSPAGVGSSLSTMPAAEASTPPAQAQVRLTTADTPATVPTPVMTALTFPIRAAFYFTWYPASASRSSAAASSPYNPLPDLAVQDSPSIVRQQIDAMQYGNIQLGIASWMGQDHYTDKQIPMLLSAGEATGFHWVLFDEVESQGDPSPVAIRSDLQYIVSQYAASPAYLKIDGRPVIFVYTDTNDSCWMVDRWAAANATVNAYLVIRVYPHHQRCDRQPDAWYQYAPAQAEYSAAPDSFTISPGYWNVNEGQPRLARDLAAWNTEIQQMIASNANFQLIATFNEWAQGTSVENEGKWLSPSGYGQYLDALHYNGNPPPAA